MGVRCVPLLKRESIRDDASEEDWRDSAREEVQQGIESEEAEVDDKGDRVVEQSKSQQSQGPRGSKSGTKTTITQPSQLPSVATASKIAVLRLPIEPDFDASQWGNKS